MAQDISSIINELNAGYDPQRQLINQQIQQLQPQADQQVAGLKQQQQDAFGDITNGARDRGMGFSGIPLQEQAKYTSSTFLPAVAKVQQSVNDTKNSLLGSLNSLTQDQYSKAYAVRDGQLTREQAAAQAAADRAAQNASSGALSSLFGQQQQTASHPYIASNPQDAQNATNAMVGLFNTKNPQLIKQTIDAITSSANRGNPYDKFKLDLLNQYKTGQYGNLINQAMAYKPSQISVGNAKQPTLSLGSAKQMTLR